VFPNGRTHRPCRHVLEEGSPIPESSRQTFSEMVARLHGEMNWLWNRGRWRNRQRDTGPEYGSQIESLAVAWFPAFAVAVTLIRRRLVRP